MATATNPITGHEVNLLPGNSKFSGPGGWIRLKNGTHDAGYINLISPPSQIADPRLIGDIPNIPPYIVIDMPMDDLAVLLDILRNEQQLQIRYDDSGAPPPFAIIEPQQSGTSSAIARKLMASERGG
jgi:hypothetical protein